ncbi:hypothetical protein [Nocardia sp. NPDC057455]|uniref:hypothetical protein n=1 Tax=Nocardia sp. NPDC057455 TaxID=3346138 RepID=UPI00366F7295
MIENTSKRDPLIHLLGAMSDGSDRYITDMEAAGQQQIVNGTEMPVKGPWEELEALGFVRGEQVDELFVRAILPDGWRKEATEHSMHSKIVDERGVERVGVFYKAAYYDRRADFHIVNPGPALARKAAWGDDPIGLPDPWGVLTDAEKRDFATALDRELGDRLDHLQYYSGDGLAREQARIERIRALIALLPATDA